MVKTKLFTLLILISLVAATPVEKYNLGDKVGDFTLKNVDGKMISLSDYNDEKGVILIFDCNTCPYSKAYLERIKQLHSTFEPKGYPVVAINSNDPVRSPGDTQEKMVSYAKKNGYKHAYLYDADQSIARAYGATNTPHVYILKNTKKGMILSYIGAIDNNTQDGNAADKKYVESAIDALLKGEEPSVTKTKAIGCTIKWKKS